MPNKNRTDFLKFDNLKSAYDFRLWIEKDLKHYYGGDDIPNAHLLIFLDYIKEVAKNNQAIDRTMWLKILDDLEDKIKAIERSRNQ